jgi:NAD(P)-dependent dehydrogenase (short-subunit alcohol dehydrogenase family)
MDTEPKDSAISTKLRGRITDKERVYQSLCWLYAGPTTPIANRSYLKRGPGLSGYQAAKFGVEGFSEALAQEVRPLGIQACMVEPGGFRTDWAGASISFAKPMDAYQATVGGFR